MRIDSHQHFWRYPRDAADFTWMTDDLVALQRDFLPADLAPLRASLGIDGSVAVQAREVEAETDFLLALAADDPSILGVVGWVDLCADDVDARLDRWAGEARLKGMRMLIHDRDDPRFAASEAHVRGVSRLGARGLTYDLLLRTVHLPAAIELVDRLPEQPFVVDHIAKPAMDGSDLDAWRRGIAEIARRPNVLCKLSGMVTEADWHGWRAETFEPYMAHVLDAFGTERLMIGSDWPVCTLAAGYEAAMRVVLDWSRALSGDERAALLGGNCARFYGLEAECRALASAG